MEKSGNLLFVIWIFTGGDPRGEWVLVTHVTDGDTIGVGRGWRCQTVRLIGIDTPETAHPEKPVEFFGPDAPEFTKRQLEGEKVHLEFETSTQYDDYGRLLAYVFLMNGTLFNAELIKQGYARVIAPSPFHRYKEFCLYEQGAREVPFVVAVSPLSWREAAKVGGGFKKLRRTCSDHVGIRGLIQAFGLIFGLDRLPDLLNPGDYVDQVVRDTAANIYCIGSPKANP